MLGMKNYFEVQNSTKISKDNKIKYLELRNQLEINFPLKK